VIAVGVGITMCLPMNISSKAKIGFVFARRGIVIEAISSYFLPRLIGYSKAMHLVTTGAVYPASCDGKEA
jgi:enoyl-CoA hydratase/carnithine racemase